MSYAIRGMLATLAFLVLAAPSAFADQSSDIKTCNDGRGQEGIDACTALIQAGNLSDKNLSAAYSYRGSDYSDQNQYALAMQDEDKAIELDSTNDLAYEYRAIVEYSIKQYQSALDDTNRAIALNPNIGAYYLGRSIVEDALGQTSASQADQAKACSIDKQACDQ